MLVGLLLKGEFDARGEDARGEDAKGEDAKGEIGLSSIKRPRWARDASMRRWARQAWVGLLLWGNTLEVRGLENEAWFLSELAQQIRKEEKCSVQMNQELRY